MNDLGYVENLATFVSVCHRGSFSAAARHASLSSSAVIRRVNSLEKALGTPLFVRSTRSLELTEAGHLLRERAIVAIQSLSDLREELGAFADTPRGILSISSLPTFARLHVLPVLARSLPAFEQLRVRLHLDERLFAPASVHQNISIRVHPSNDSSLVSSPLCVHRAIYCASPAYIDKYGSAKDFSQLVLHRRIGLITEVHDVGWQSVLGAAAEGSRERQVLECDDFDVRRRAAVLGLGIARLPTWAIHDELRLGQLVEILHAHSRLTPDTKRIVALRPRGKPSQKVRWFVEALRDSLTHIDKS